MVPLAGLLQRHDPIAQELVGILQLGFVAPYDVVARKLAGSAISRKNKGLVRDGAVDDQ